MTETPDVLIPQQSEAEKAAALMHRSNVEHVLQYQAEKARRREELLESITPTGADAIIE